MCSKSFLWPKAVQQFSCFAIFQKGFTYSVDVAQPLLLCYVDSKIATICELSGVFFDQRMTCLCTNLLLNFQRERLRKNYGVYGGGSGPSTAHSDPTPQPTVSVSFRLHCYSVIYRTAQQPYCVHVFTDTHNHTHTHTISHAHSFTYFHTVSHTYTQCHTHSLTVTLTVTHTHTYLRTHTNLPYNPHTQTLLWGASAFTKQKR